jgi:Zn-dependent peptidase ImmA (M78 family)
VIDKAKSVSDEAREASINYAKDLVARFGMGHSTAYDRLWSLARHLGVVSICSGATKTDGFLKRLSDSTYVIYYSLDSSREKRRFTVAHELAHIVVDRFSPHLDTCIAHRKSAEMADACVERAVDRVAAELLMPSEEVVGNLIAICNHPRDASSGVGSIDAIVGAAKVMGVSYTAMLRRMIELEEVIAIYIVQEMCDDNSRKPGRRFIQCSEALGDFSMSIVHRNGEGRCCELKSLVNERGLNLRVVWDRGAKAATLRCDGRAMPERKGGEKQWYYWTVGWDWAAGLLACSRNLVKRQGSQETLEITTPPISPNSSSHQ